MRIDFSSQDYLRNPAAEIAKLRAAGPLIEVRFPIVGKVWTTTTQELADQVLKDSETFRLRREDGRVAGLQWWMPGIVRTLANNMLSQDEPDHQRLRDIVDEAFRRRAVLDLEPDISLMAEELSEDLFAMGTPADLVGRYARRLPLSVICELLGLPLADRPKFTAWAMGFSRFKGALGFLSMIPNVLAMKRYMEKQLDLVRTSGGHGLIAELVRVEKEGGKISRDEMVAMMFLLLFAGHETTTHLISGSVFELLRKPDLRDWLEEDWSRAALAVEEFLRFVTPVQFTKPRIARKDVTLCGVKIRKGEKVMPMLAAVNLDPAANERPETLDLARKPNRHLAFGTGIHFCLGHQLARIEAKCALKALFQRWPKLELAIDESEVRWRERPGLRAIERLPVRA
ncbi:MULTISPECIES: cytochrome P450 [unclassified Sinorhizobium]|uniref:cytochrome P450 n=1 Tax=unclassified Sinorhizobium TaxID=2613772 RepID=UPI003526B834